MNASPLQNCRLCRSANLQHKAVVRTHLVMRCGECGFIQLGAHPTKEQIEHTYSRSYFKNSKYRLDAGAQKEQDRRINLMRECGLAPAANILDIGCATGDFVLRAKETFSMWGADISEQAIDIARKRNPDIASCLFSMSKQTIDSLNRTFDAVTMWDVIEHLDDPVGLLQALVKKIKPTGFLFFSTPNIGAIVPRLMGARWAFMTPPEHIGYFSRDTMKRLLATCGLREFKWETNGKWVNLGFLMYKLGRVFPEITPRSLVEFALESRLGRVTIYVPTGDIQYVVGVPV